MKKAERREMLRKVKMTPMARNGTNRSTAHWNVEADFVTRPPAQSLKGVVTSTNSIATSVGLQVLAQTGNAFDAVCAMAFTSFTVEPEYSGYGGELVGLFRSAEDGRVRVLSGQGPAPKQISGDFLRRLGYSSVPAFGYLSAVVPGSLAALIKLLGRHGTASLEQVIGPALDYARQGFVVSDRLAAKVQAAKGRLSRWPQSAALWLPGGRPIGGGEVHRNPQLADFIEGVLNASSRAASRSDALKGARDHIYHGPPARLIISACTASPPSRIAAQSGGRLSMEDLATYDATFEEPVSLQFRGWKICKASAWTQGPTLLEALGIFDRTVGNLATPQSAGDLHSLIESFKLAYADRDCFFGDDPRAELAVTEILTDGYLRRRSQEITDSACGSFRPGRLSDASLVASSGFDEVNRPGGRGSDGDTGFVGAADQLGNVVALTISGGWLQDSPVVPRLGFPLSTRAQMFNMSENHPNCIAPGKRPRTTLSPTLAIGPSSEVLAFGSPGADLQEQAAAALLVATISTGMPLQQAVELAAIRTSHFHESTPPHRFGGNQVLYEPRLRAEQLDELRARGHLLDGRPDFFFSAMCAIKSDRGILTAAAGPTNARSCSAGL